MTFIFLPRLTAFKINLFTNPLPNIIINLKKMKISYELTHKLRDIDNKADYCENIN